MPPNLPLERVGARAAHQKPRPVLAGAIRSRTALRLVEEWASLHGADLEANWRRVQAGEPLEKIAPLE